MPLRKTLKTILPGLLMAIMCLTDTAAAEPKFNLSVTPTAACQGEISLMTITPTMQVKNISYKVDRKSYDCFKLDDTDRYFGIIPFDLDTAPAKKEILMTATDTSGNSIEHTAYISVIAKEYPIQRMSLPEGKVTLSPENLARHKLEKKALTAALSSTEQKKIWRTKFTQPHTGKITGKFGVRRILNDKPKSRHSGVDLRAPLGAPVAAIGDGVVVFTGDHFFTGNNIFIDHGMNIISMYFHLSEILVQPGDSITGGQLIGKVGSTGRSTGPHLHWGVKINGKRINPIKFIELINRIK
ncbi:MAG: M23 family metallopeptidase [Deltaproteobacteria bacterium]|nr:M23 family metallopeptidase [Deltaproteobacteria bacterium]